MKEKLTEILGLPSNASDDVVIEAVKQMASRDAAAKRIQNEEAEISSLIRESAGALSRETARQVLADRARTTHEPVI